jgi:hypothetical protein
MSETISDLRSHLFDALRGLSDKTHPMDIERAKAIADVSQVIINSAKVEVEHMKVSGGNGSGFLADLREKTETIEERPGVTITRHRLI